MTNRALDGVRVIELGQIYNGPYCGLLLAQLGAEVIKVEPPQGEPLRFRSTNEVESHEFLMLNSNKRSVVLDLKSEQGRSTLLALLGTADVLIENFAPGTMDRLGLGTQTLLEHNAQLIVASGKGYGSSGPYADLSAMDITVQAMSGSIASTGFPDGPPVKSGVAFVDFSGGVHLTAAVLAALYQRERTGAGQSVEVSMHDTVYPMLASSLGALYDNPDRTLPERTGNRHSGLAISPYNVYRALDGWIAVICLSDRHWSGIAEAMSRPDLVVDPRFASQRERVRNMQDLDAVMTAWTEGAARDALVQALGDRGVPCAPVKSVREVEHDPHLLERGTIQFVEHPIKGRVPVPASALRLSASSPVDIELAAALGSSTDEIVREVLGEVR